MFLIYRFAHLIEHHFFRLFGRNLIPRCRVKEINRNLMVKSVAYAKSPSDFPIFDPNASTSLKILSRVKIFA